jgi:hypothetical protein
VQALASVHAAGVLHGDLDLSNILVDEQTVSICCSTRIAAAVLDQTATLEERGDRESVPHSGFMILADVCLDPGLWTQSLYPAPNRGRGVQGACHAAHKAHRRQPQEKW